MALETGNTALLLCVLLGVVSVSVWVQWEEGIGVKCIIYPLDSDFLCCISWENEDTTLYEIHMYCGIGFLKHERYHN